MKIIDLSVAIEDHGPSDPPPLQPVIEYVHHAAGAELMKPFFPGITPADLPKGLGWAVEEIKLNSHCGTHLDAPWHYHPTMNQGEPSRTIDQMPLEWCFSDGVVVDFSHIPATAKVQIPDFEQAFLAMGYQLKPLDIVLVRSGAAPFYGTTRYLGEGCGISREATLWLLEKGVKVVGTDAWSWDRPLPVMAREFADTKDASVIWEGHFAGIEREYYHMEKMTNLDLLPPFGFKVCCFPVKIKAASAGWTRAVAILQG